LWRSFFTRDNAPPSSPAQHTSLSRDHFRTDDSGGSLRLSATAPMRNSLRLLRAVPALISLSSRTMLCHHAARSQVARHNNPALPAHLRYECLRDSMKASTLANSLTFARRVHKPLPSAFSSQANTSRVEHPAFTRVRPHIGEAGCTTNSTVALDPLNPHLVSRGCTISSHSEEKICARGRGVCVCVLAEQRQGQYQPLVLLGQQKVARRVRVGLPRTARDPQRRCNTHTGRLPAANSKGTY
jgi:hypothetical protein